MFGVKKIGAMRDSEIGDCPLLYVVSEPLPMVFRPVARDMRPHRALGEENAPAFGALPVVIPAGRTSSCAATLCFFLLSDLLRLKTKAVKGNCRFGYFAKCVLAPAFDRRRPAPKSGTDAPPNLLRRRSAWRVIKTVYNECAS